MGQGQRSPQGPRQDDERWVAEVEGSMRIGVDGDVREGGGIGIGIGIGIDRNAMKLRAKGGFGGWLVL